MNTNYELLMHTSLPLLSKLMHVVMRHYSMIFEREANRTYTFSCL